MVSPGKTGLAGILHQSLENKKDMLKSISGIYAKTNILLLFVFNIIKQLLYDIV
jgi:hypothetical protein